MKKIVMMVSMLVVVLAGSAVFGQDASASGTAGSATPTMCGALDVPVGCICKDAGKNELDCAAGVEVAVPAGEGKMVVENGGKTTIYIPEIEEPECDDCLPPPEVEDDGWNFWDWTLFVGGAAALGVGTYYAVDSMTTTEVHIRDK